jgi:3'-phosphoadenosine 5'-phosphosulfate sulfotransferase (PAPS reductase)/FAD synthetase
VRTLAWFSAGAASAVAAKLALSESTDVTVMRIDPGSEHPDNIRFASDVAAWLGVDIRLLKSTRYTDTWDVWNRRRFIVGPKGALCTTELKKMVRHTVEVDYDRQVFGYTIEEQHRVDRFRNEHPDINLWCPLVDHELTKQDCLAIVAGAGIALPVMYRLGFQNNNCIGCPKGGMGYWNHIRRHFPAEFNRMALLERNIGHSCLSDAAGPVWLDELDPYRGDVLTEPSGECSLFCAGAEALITP